MIEGSECTENHEMGTYMGASGRYDGLLGWLVVIARGTGGVGYELNEKKKLVSNIYESGDDCINGSVQ